MKATRYVRLVQRWINQSGQLGSRRQRSKAGEKALSDPCVREGVFDELREVGERCENPRSERERHTGG